MVNKNHANASLMLWCRTQVQSTAEYRSALEWGPSVNGIIYVEDSLDFAVSSRNLAGDLLDNGAIPGVVVIRPI